MKKSDILKHRHIEHNKYLVKNHMKKITYDEFIDMLYGKIGSTNKKAPTFVPTLPASYRSTKQFKSVTAPVVSPGCSKKESLAYTGEQKLLGIATLHKSCLQPVFSAEFAKDVATMRRN